MRKQIAHKQLNRHNYFNFADSRVENLIVPIRVEAEECTQGNQFQIPTHSPHQGMSDVRTSYTEYEGDALALKTDEGRGDRRNVQGELHPSDEPWDSQ